MAKDPREVKTQMLALCSMASVLTVEDVQGYLDELNRYDTVGPILDPTGYRATMKQAQNDAKLFGAFLKFRQTIEDLGIVPSEG